MLTPEDKANAQIADIERKLGALEGQRVYHRGRADDADLLARELRARLFVEYKEDGHPVGACEEYARAHPRYRSLRAIYLRHRRNDTKAAAEIAGLVRALDSRNRAFDLWRTKEATNRELIKRGIHQ